MQHKHPLSLIRSQIAYNFKKRDNSTFGSESIKDDDVQLIELLSAVCLQSILVTLMQSNDPIARALQIDEVNSDFGSGAISSSGSSSASSSGPASSTDDFSSSNTSDLVDGGMKIYSFFCPACGIELHVLEARAHWTEIHPAIPYPW